MKRCRGCGRELPPEMFGPRRAKCKACRSAQAKVRNATEEARAKRREATRAGYAAAREVLNRLKEGPCTDCGGTFPPYIMEFDHRVPSQDQTRRVSSFAAARHIPGMLAEIEKCDLVCPNCHRIRTHRQLEAGLFKTGRPRKTGSA
jgi:5-methylcytosine-specific restriction endonuclease McrA